MDFLFAGYRVATTFGDVVSMSECVTDVVGADSFGWEMFFSDRTSAEQACAGAAATHVFAVGFHRDDVPALLSDLEDNGSTAAAGLPDRLRAAQPMPEGDVLGCELVGWDPNVWHTWMCLGGLVCDVGDATGAGPGVNGLIQDVERARLAAEWLNTPGHGDPKVALWVTALLVRPLPEA